MEPEISHRCTSCGASIRAGVKFCPQCGVKTGKAGTNVVLQDTAALVEPVKSEEGKRPRGSTAPTQPFKPEMANLSFTADPTPEENVLPAPKVGPRESTIKTAPLSPVIHTRRQSVKNAARGIVEENVRPRVEKLRHASSVVLEEASAIDPSLRFILIAAFLFIVFIVLLGLSFVR